MDEELRWRVLKFVVDGIMGNQNRWAVEARCRWPAESGGDDLGPHNEVAANYDPPMWLTWISVRTSEGSGLVAPDLLEVAGATGGDRSIHLPEIPNR